MYTAILYFTEDGEILDTQTFPSRKKARKWRKKMNKEFANTFATKIDIIKKGA